MSLRSRLAAVVGKAAHPAAPRTDSAEGSAVPDPFLQLMERAWRAQPEDTVGGWCITLADDPRTPADGALAIAMFLSRDVATHIAEMHNRSLDHDGPDQPGARPLGPGARSLRADAGPPDAAVPPG